MALTNFPNGISSQGVPVLGSGPVFTTGSIYFVDSATGSDGNKGADKTRPFATLDYAVGQCTANKGDYIIVMPNHAETITGAAGIAFDVAGVSAVGLGSYNQRPRFLMDGGTTVTAVISAADVSLSNLVFASGHADVVACIGVTAVGASLDNIEFADNTTAENWLTPIKATGTTDNEADGLSVTNCKWYSVDAGGLEFIEGNADIEALVVRNNYVAHEGTASPLLLMATGKDVHYCDIRDNVLAHKMTANELLVNVDTSANFGIIGGNWVGHADVTTTHDLGIDALGCRLFDNLSVSTDALSGLLLPAADVNS